MASEYEPLDEAKLSDDAGPVYLFRWLCKTEQFLKSSHSDDLKLHQNQLEESLLRVIISPEPFPSPGRPLRNTVARCLRTLYTKAETRSMYDTLQALLKIVADHKVVDKDVQKIAAFYIIGELMIVFGSQVMSLMGDIAATSLRTFKSSTTPLVRYAALTALRQSLPGARKAIPDQVMKDIIKQGKSALTDKSLPAQRAGSDLLSVIYAPDATAIGLSDIDAILSACIRSLENADQTTRTCLARLAGQVLAASQVEQVITTAEPSKKPKKDAAEGENEASETTAVPTEARKALLSVSDMLSQLSVAFNKPQTSRKLRIGIFDIYASLFSALGSGFVQANYGVIVSHFMADIISHARSNASRYDKLLTRRLVSIILRDLIAVQLLGEQSQISAVQELTATYLRRWPALMPGQVAPNPQVLTTSLFEVTGLVQQLGSLPQATQDILLDPLITLLGHPQHTTRVHAAKALRGFCYAAPARLPSALLNVLELLQRDIGILVTPTATVETTSRALGHAYGLSALVAVVSERPLYVSYDITAKVLDVAIQLLKRAGDHDIKVAATEVEVAWTLIAALMTLGPNFVRSQLPQLLVLWRNALPKPTSKDTAGAATRSSGEWMFLLHVRESALGAILSFLIHNNTALVTLDVARRITSLLGHALTFANTFVANPKEEPTPEQMVLNRSLHSREASLRRRIYKCFTILGLSSVTDTTQASLLQSVVGLFASPEGYMGSPMQAAIASSAGTVISIWQSTDGYAYGVTQIDDAGATDIIDANEVVQSQTTRDAIEDCLQELVNKPVIPSLEHDALSVCTSKTTAENVGVLALPPATAVVDASLELFSLLLPHQEAAAATRVLQQLVDSIRSPKLERNTGRKAAVLVNAVVGIQLSLREMMISGKGREALRDPKSTELISGVLMDAVVSIDPEPRNAASDALGRLAGVTGTHQLSSIIKILVDRVVNNRDPYGRAGCALAFGSIFAHVGGLTAGPLLKTAVNVLISLSHDPHPVVHYWALRALAKVIDAASLSYAPFVSSTLSMAFKIYSSESHEPNGGTFHNANIGGDMPAYEVLCTVIDAVINVLGPDMQETSNTQSLALHLAQELFAEMDEGITVEALKCVQHIIMFAPSLISVPELVAQLESHLHSPRRPLKIASLHALYQLVQKDALIMSRLGGDQLVEQLFQMLDSDPSIEGVRSVITSWLKQTAVHNPSAWIDLCLRIMLNTRPRRMDTGATTGTGQDDEGESLNAAAAITSALPSSRWRTQLFALQCLHTICTLVANSGRREHIDIPFARKQGVPLSPLLVSRVHDLIKIAFTASAAYVTDIRLEGLVVLRDVIEIFRQSPDPDFEDALLLEQHQAPITAALTPAFSSDSSPEVLASAVEACAVFVGSGIIKEVSKMGRILKLLTSALQQSQTSGTLTIGDAGELSPNASVMLRIATLAAWGELQVASLGKEYLKNVLAPHTSSLVVMWVASLRDYAALRAEHEMSGQEPSLSALEPSSSNLGRDVLLPYYSEAWPILLHAVAIAMQADDPAVVAAMDGQDTIDRTSSGHTGSPAALFFVIYGLAFDALASSSVENATNTTDSRRNVAIALLALRSLVKPQYSGDILAGGPIFEELISLLHRMALTEPADSLIGLVDVVKDLSYIRTPNTGLSTRDDENSSTAQHIQCLRLIAFILRSAIQDCPSSRIQLVATTFEAFTELSSKFEENQRESLRAIAVSFYSDMLKAESTAIDLASSILPSLKRLLSPPSPTALAYAKTAHAFLSQCVVNIDTSYGREGSMATKKIQANLLAITLTLSTASPMVTFGFELLERCCFIISSQLCGGNHEISLTASHCTRTLVTASTSATTLKPCVPFLLPGLVEFMAGMTTIDAQSAHLSQLVATASEVLQTFSLIQSTVTEGHWNQWSGLLIPLVVIILQNQEPALKPLQPILLRQILQVAALDPAAFKVSMGELSSSEQDVLELALRGGTGQKVVQPTNAANKPQISLRAF